MGLEDTQRIEREKWDAVAAKEYGEAALVPPYDSFEEYARSNIPWNRVGEFLGDLRGKKVLEYGCGFGKMTVLLAKSGADVSAFDISEGSVDLARRRLELNGLKADIIVAAGEDLPYPDESFEIVVGRGVLHHLHAEEGWPHLHRVLEPGGKAGFVEPMGMNPLLNLVRDHVPYPHKTPGGDDHPLTYDDIQAWGKGFTSFEFKEVQLLSMVERVFGFGTRFRPLHRLDARLLEKAPSLRKYCRFVDLRMVK